MKFLKSIRPAAAAVGLITAGLPKDLKISDASKYLMNFTIVAFRP